MNHPEKIKVTMSKYNNYKDTLKKDIQTYLSYEKLMNLGLNPALTKKTLEVRIINIFKMFCGSADGIVSDVDKKFIKYVESLRSMGTKEMETEIEKYINDNKSGNIIIEGI